MLNRNYFLTFSSISLVVLGMTALLSSSYCLNFDKDLLLSFQLFSLGSVNFLFTLYFDLYSLLFFSFVTFISSAVIWYSTIYMENELHLKRFISLVLLFVFSMSLMIFSLNLVSILLGWDGLGIISYALVIFYQNEKSNAAGMITALSNRIGDAALLLAIAVSISSGSWNFLFTLKETSNFSFLLTGLIILAAMTKSAQTPFSAWLPAAMAAPTPVSALVHSSTLVTAGVYLLIRFYPLLAQSNLSHYLFFIGALTTFSAGFSAIAGSDLKKMIALSTLSQLGIMMSAVAVGLPSFAFFHLLTHAMFKALLFLCAGKVIHEFSDTQDIRKMGGILNSLPFTSTCLNFSNLSLMGIPFLSGFYSKDLIIEMIFMTNLGAASFILLWSGVGMTATYSLLLAYFSMISPSNALPLSKVKEKDLEMMIPKTCLILLSITSGAMLTWFLFPHSCVTFVPWVLKTSTMLSVCLGFVLSSILMSFKHETRNFKPSSKILSFFPQFLFYPALTSSFILKSLNHLTQSVKLLETRTSEKMQSKGTFSFLLKLSNLLTKSQTNSLSSFLMVFMLSVLLLTNM